jgi:hypothetical protein
MISKKNKIPGDIILQTSQRIFKMLKIKNTVPKKLD